MSLLTSSKEKTNGTRLARLLVDGGTEVLRNVLYSVHPRDNLQRALNENRAKLKRVFDDQREKLFPSSGDPPKPEAFDMTLLYVLLQKICDLKAPASTGWNKMPADSDRSREANIVRINCFRNEYGHWFSTGIADDEFNDKWAKISKTMVELGFDQGEIDRLRTEPIDHDTERRVQKELEIESRVEGVEQRQDNLEQRQGISEHRQDKFEQRQDRFEDRMSTIAEERFSKVATHELSNCLPDKVRHVYGRSEETRKVVEAIQSGKEAVVLITGGPGVGKTTVAKVVAHELAQAENKPTVLFCSLISKKTFHEVATEMIYSCGTIQTQLPENPEQWLKDWSKQIQTQVTFILDNADGVLESDDRNLFLKTLRDTRMFSKQNVTFVITARKTFKDFDLQPQEVRLNPVSAEEAKNIIVSRLSDTQKKLSKIYRMVELCGCVPLALCIVGSLLSDYTEDKLIKHLEEDPLTVLKDDEASVAKAIKTSFDHLTEDEQKAFVLMSVFPGSFNSDDAEAIMAACSNPESPPVSILRSLKNRSLLEQPHLCRYQIHPLIHAFANTIREKYPQLIDQANKKACVHFMSRFADNANAHWSKDKCKESIESFNEDRHNFEYFLQKYVQAREKQDREIVDACKTFLHDFPQKCMYLERCVLPGFFILILEGLLETFKPEPVHRVELLCLLGHERRKEGDKQKYESLMEEAEKVFSGSFNEFTTKALSEVYFRNSYARFLSAKKDRNENQRIAQEIGKALEVSKEQLGDHPEKAATLLRAGINAKRRKKYREAKNKLREALELYKKLLGEHFMTALVHKNIADLHLQSNKLDKCLVHFTNAIEMFENLGMGDHKEIVLTLNNFAICHREKENFEDAVNAFTKAEQVAERELEQDHAWKVKIKTEQALLYDKMGRPDQAKAVMREGLLMGNKLNLPIVKMGNKDEIREFINRYPDTFPEKEFPRSVCFRDSPSPNYVPQAGNSRTTVGRRPRNVSVDPRKFQNIKRPLDYGKAFRPGSRGRDAWERSTGNRFSALAGEDNFSAPIEQTEDFGDFDRQEPGSPMPRAGRSGDFQSGEQELVVQAGTQPKIHGSTSQRFAVIQEKLRTLILEKKARNEEVLEWINKNVPAADTKEAPFIRALVTVVCEDTMEREEGGQCKCNINRFKDRKPLLQKYIDDNIHLQLQALYAVQALFVQLDYPPGFIKSYFDCFYDEEIITEKSFIAWESSPEEELGKSVALAASAEFFRWLRSSAEEPGQES